MAADLTHGCIVVYVDDDGRSHQWCRDLDAALEALRGHWASSRYKPVAITDKAGEMVMTEADVRDVVCGREPPWSNDGH